MRYNYKDDAIFYAEKYGILEWTMKGSKMIYYANYPKYLAEPRRTYKVVYDLKSGVETRTLLKKWNRKGNANMYK